MAPKNPLASRKCSTLILRPNCLLCIVNGSTRLPPSTIKPHYRINHDTPYGVQKNDLTLRMPGDHDNINPENLHIPSSAQRTALPVRMSTSQRPARSPAAVVVAATHEPSHAFLSCRFTHGTQGHGGLPPSLLLLAPPFSTAPAIEHSGSCFTTRRPSHHHSLTYIPRQILSQLDSLSG